MIVASILLAFWIDAAWDSRQSRQAEATVLESIRAETEENRRELDTLLLRHEVQAARMNLFLAQSGEGLRTLPQDSVFPWLAAMIITWTFDADNSAAGLFLDSATPVTSYARDVRGELAQWVRVVDDLEEEKATLWDLGARLAQRLAERAVPAATADQGLLHEVAARQGPSVLEALRSDAVFVATLRNKAHYQAVYALELNDASRTLDSLRSLLTTGPAGEG